MPVDSSAIPGAQYSAYLLHTLRGDDRRRRSYEGSAWFAGLRRHPTPEELEDVEHIPIETPKGSVAVWDGAVWHSGGIGLYRVLERFCMQPTRGSMFSRSMTIPTCWRMKNSSGILQKNC